MPKKIRDYLFKIKSPRPQIRLPSKNWILSGCKHPRTPSFALYSGRNQPHHHQHHVVRNNKDNYHHPKDDAATLADVDRFLFENFKSLYLKDDEETLNTKRVFDGDDQNHEVVEETTSPRDLRGSTRFFVKPGFSGSLVEDAFTNTNTTTSDEVGSVSTVSTLYDVSSSSSYEKEGADHALPDNSIALLSHSTSPYEDFRRSMQEMVDNHEGVVDWDFMEELLFCYLNLNHKKSHKFILGAFVDLITVMRRSNSQPASDKPRSVRTVRSGRELRDGIKNVILGFGSS